MKKILLITSLLFSCFLTSCNDTKAIVTFKYMDMKNENDYFDAKYTFYFVDSEINYTANFTFEKNHIITEEEWEDMQSTLTLSPDRIHMSCFRTMSGTYSDKDHPSRENCFGEGKVITTDLTCYYTTWG